VIYVIKGKINFVVGCVLQCVAVCCSVLQCVAGCCHGMCFAIFSATYVVVAGVAGFPINPIQVGVIHPIQGESQLCRGICLAIYIFRATF